MVYNRWINRSTKNDAKCLHKNIVVTTLRDLPLQAPRFAEQMPFLLLLCLFLCCFCGEATSTKLDAKEQIDLRRLSYDLTSLDTMNRGLGNGMEWSSQSQPQKRYGIGPHHRVSIF